MKPLLAALFAVPIAEAAAQAPEVRRDGPHTAVLVRRGALPGPLAGQLADAALAAAELAWTTLQKPLQLPANGPRVTVVLYAAEPQFRTAEKTGCALPFPVEAFPSFADATAHVLLWPKLSGRALDRIGLPASTRDAVLHTAALLHAQRATGTPPEARDRLEVAAAGALALAYNPKGQDGIDAAYDTNRWEFTAQGQKGKVPDLRAWLQDGSAVTNRRDHDLRVARWAVLAQAMEPHGNWLKKLLQKPKPGSSQLARTRRCSVPSGARPRPASPSRGPAWRRAGS